MECGFWPLLYEHQHVTLGPREVLGHMCCADQPLRGTSFQCHWPGGPCTWSRSPEFRVSIDNSARFVGRLGLGLWHLKMAVVQSWKEVARLVGTHVGNGKEGCSYPCQVQVLPSFALQGGGLVVPFPGTGLGALTTSHDTLGQGAQA